MGKHRIVRASGITQPSRLAQEQMMTETYEHAGLSPNRTRYVEAHGTGTPVGDPIEASPIGAVFGKYRSTSDPLYCGSIKANIGHLEGASGIAGLMKSILILEKGLIPPNAGFERVNPNIKADSLNLKFPMEITPWPAKGLRRVSVNSFGFGGTNAHIILDDAYHYLQEHGLKGLHNTTFNEGESLQNGFHNHKRFGNSKQNGESDKALKYNEATLGNGDRNSFYEVHSDDYGVSSDDSDCSEGALNLQSRNKNPLQQVC
ncbi:hypothetical protein HYALB_00011979 [Hymenoscyphus albidus]|uniref:Ketosynthase family 3 (KS3) domain-containing protein n=1 Tax=Hymenoscyphus albidus TaxID=595503 RepID=A0A9N9Q3Z5_9HELO|nr:hypothetical protein HYALB_00011979 [Hymenoscyphus albidus]